MTELEIILGFISLVTTSVGGVVSVRPAFGMEGAHQNWSLPPDRRQEANL